MWLLVWVLNSVVHHVNAERGGITHCAAGTKFPTTLAGAPTGSPAAIDSGILVQDGDFMFDCCGVVQGLAYYADSDGDIDAQIWRQTGENAFELISQSTYTITAGSPGSFTAADDARLSFQEGDQIGWYGAGGILVRSKTDTNYQLARVSTVVGAQTVGNTFDWSVVDSGADELWLIQFDVTESTTPFFTNLPATLTYVDTDTLISGITLMTLAVDDLDPDDVTGLTVEMDPEWSDYFSLDTSTLVLTTSRKLEPGTYSPEFRVEEAHCGKVATAILTVTVSDSTLTITNLPASASVHEDTRDETLLHTLTTSDPTDQPIWCKGDWTIGTGGSDKPFVVKMLSTASGDSRAGIYLIEEPALDYDSTAQFYSLSVTCTDTKANTFSGSFYVNVLKNQLPIFTNLANAVEIDATVARIGTTIFTVSTSDAEGDQITYTSTCTPSANCPVELYDNGDVIVTSSTKLFLLTTTTFTLSVTASDLRDSTTARDLIIYIKNTNTAPTFTNLNANVNVSENTALGTSLFQVSATDADSDTLTYYMTMNTDEGWQLFELSSAGLVSTHSSYNINYEPLAATTHLMVVYAHDGYQVTSATLTLTVQDVAETLTFTQTTYGLSNDEGAAGPLNSPNIGVRDPDAGATATFSMTCGTYNSYFSIDTTSAAVSFALSYDLDTGSVPTEVTCNLTAVDDTGFNDTAELVIVVNYVNDHTPTFSPATYSKTLLSTAPLGYNVLTVTATDADRDLDGEFSYSIDTASFSPASHSGYFLVSNTGVIYTAQALSSIATFGANTFDVLAIDRGSPSKTGTAAVTVTILDASVAATTTTDRNWNFTDDSRNIYWLTAAVITAVACLFVIAIIIIRYCMGRTEPLCKGWWTSQKNEKRPLDKNRRPKPFGRQQIPTYRHVHSKEVLRPSPPAQRKPEPIQEEDENFSTRAQSASSLVSGRVNLSQVNLKDQGKTRATDDDINSWMSGTGSPTRSLAPERAVTRPRVSDRDYMRPGARRRTTTSTNTNKGPVHSSSPPAPPSPSVTLPGDLTSDRLQTSESPLNVNPSPVFWDNTGPGGADNMGPGGGTNNNSFVPSEDDDDFRSERISIVSPVTVHSSTKEF